MFYNQDFESHWTSSLHDHSVYYPIVSHWEMGKFNGGGYVLDPYPISPYLCSILGPSFVFPAIDSWGKPGPSLLEGRLIMAGNYRQCRNVTAHTTDGRFKGNYCVMNIIMVDNSVGYLSCFFFFNVYKPWIKRYLR